MSRTPLADLIAAPARAEREAIVKWLRMTEKWSRDDGNEKVGNALAMAAWAIERGDHLK